MRDGIGWFGVPGKTPAPSKSPKTHLVVNGKLQCGIVISRKKVFQWCSTAGYLTPECKRCRNHQAEWVRGKDVKAKYKMLKNKLEMKLQEERTMLRITSNDLHYGIARGIEIALKIVEELK